ncbi:MAG: hypothetical protein OJI67_20665 [Prosthecobacter sp.]|nr:hypothetical protein [Prosthecobacter sp.]
MDTVRVDISYRPLRLGWAIKSGDMDALREVVRNSYALWGGRANPILVVDDLEQARRMADLFQIDQVWPVGGEEEVKHFNKKFPHLIDPIFSRSLFLKSGNGTKKCTLLDIQNALTHGRDSSAIKDLREAGFKLFSWSEEDPLADVLRIQFGEYPPPTVGIDYREMVKQTLNAEEINVDLTSPIGIQGIGHPGIPFLCRQELIQDYGMRGGGWNTPGFYVGDATSFEDLVCYWNLRASGIPLWFVDPAHSARYARLIPAWKEVMRELVGGSVDPESRIAIWSRREDFDAFQPLFGDENLIHCHVSDILWNGLNLRAPRLIFSPVTTLGILSARAPKERPKVSFALANKPFDGDTWFHTQHLVASVSFIGGLYGNENYLLQPPFIPELNEFYARTLHFDYSKLRIERSGIGVVIDAADSDVSLNALAVSELFQKIFEMAGYHVKTSGSGLLARQLISQMGGLQGTRAFKIAGVRRLIRSFGLNATFSRSEALNLISSVNPEEPDKKFSDHTDLYIKGRKIGSDLKPHDVFTYLVEKGLFRIGVDLVCPSCSIRSWYAVNALQESVNCDLCGEKYESVRQLVDGQWRYRRSGILGFERNAKGAIPVALTLQQLDATFGHGLQKSAYAPSLDIRRTDGTDVECEIDFAWIGDEPSSRKVCLIIGECKDRGAIRLEDFRRDVDNMRKVADSFPSHRFDVFILFSKLSTFSDEEVELARTLNGEFTTRVILLSDRDLEPFYLGGFERSAFGKGVHIHGPLDLARATQNRYFR